MTEKQNNSIGDLFREKLSGYRAEPPESVWGNIRTQLPKHISYGKIALYSVVTAVVITAITVFLFELNSEQNQPESIAVQNSEIVETEQSNVNVDPIVDNTEDDKPIVEISQNSQKVTLGNERVNKKSETKQIEKVETFEKQSPLENNISTIDNEKLIVSGDTIEQTSKFANDKLWETVMRIVDKEFANKENEENCNTQITNIALGPEKNVCYGEEVVLCAPDGSGFLWNTEETDATIVVMPEETTIYTLDYVDLDGRTCRGSIKVNVNECSVFVPNAFSPNGDGKNEIFKAQGKGMLDFRLIVFSRWGEQVFESSDPDHGWDGTFRGRKSPKGIYIYTVTFRDENGYPHKKYGSFSLVDFDRR